MKKRRHSVTSFNLMTYEVLRLFKQKVFHILDLHVFKPFRKRIVIFFWSAEKF